MAMKTFVNLPEVIVGLSAESRDFIYMDMSAIPEG
jgi:hypothetical protein